jgi:hypothetical protein
MLDFLALADQDPTPDYDTHTQRSTSGKHTTCNMPSSIQSNLAGLQSNQYTPAHSIHPVDQMPATAVVPSQV